MQVTNRVYDIDEHVIGETIQNNGRVIVYQHIDDGEYTSQVRIYQGINLAELTKRTDRGGFVKTIYDADNNPVSIIEVNDQGQLLQMQLFDKKHRKTTYSFVYDAYSNLVKQLSQPSRKILPSITEYWLDPPKTTYFSRWNGNALRYEEGTPDSTNEYDGITKGYFKNDKISLVIARDAHKRPRHIEKYQDGNIHQELFLRQNGKLSSKTLYDFHREGMMDIRTTYTETYDPASKIQETSSRERHYQPANVLRAEIFQFNGQLISKTFYIRDAQNQLVSRIVCEYNAQYQCVKETHHNARNEIQKEILYEYNTARKCIDSYQLINGKWMSTKNPKKAISPTVLNSIMNSLLSPARLATTNNKGSAPLTPAALKQLNIGGRK